MITSLTQEWLLRKRERVVLLAEETAHAEDSVRELWYSKEPNQFTLDAAALGEEGAGVGARGKGEEVNWSQNQGAL